MDGLFNSQLELIKRMSNSYKNFQKLGKIKMTATACQTRLSQLERDFSTFLENHSNMVQQDNYSTHDYSTKDVFDSAQEIYFESVGNFKEHLLTFNAPSTLDESVHNQTKTEVGVNSLNNSLPKIEISKFSGKLTEWARFRDLFVSLVHNRTDLTPVIKFYHLSSLVEGAALDKIRNLDVTAENYHIAWAALTEFYENKRRLINHSVGQLFSTRSMKSDSYSELSALFTSTFDTVGFLSSLGRSIEITGVDLLVFLTVSKFDPVTRREWEKSLGDSTQASSLGDLKKFFRDHLALLESVEVGSRSHTISKPTNPKTHVSTTSEQTSTPKPKPCFNCGEAHQLVKCGKFKTLSGVDRLALARSQKLCFLCLLPHPFKDCRKKTVCALCKRKHHTLLHDGIAANKLAKLDEPGNNATPSGPHPQLPGLNTSANTFSPSQPTFQNFQQSMNTVTRDSFVLLPTAWVKVEFDGKDHLLRALIDQASQVSLITENCSQRLGLTRYRSDTSIEGVSSLFSEKTRGRVTFKVRSLVDTDFSIDVDAMVLGKITNYRPLISSELGTLPHLSAIQLADPEFFNLQSIDLLLGAEVHAIIILNEILRGSPWDPIASNTRLGWVVSGPSSASSAPSTKSCHLIDNTSLLRAVEKFWAHEEVITPQPLYTDDEKACEAHFVNTHSRNAEGRYIVRLPFNEKVIRDKGFDLRGSFNRALAVLLSLRKKFRDPVFCTKYCNFVAEFEQLGHMSLVSPLNAVQRDYAFYLPHHGVLNSRGKLRTVFNGSARVGGGLSLNDYLLPGPNLIPDLRMIVSKWRRYPFVFVTDVVKMFRQIIVHPDDRHYLLILWQGYGDEILTYALNTVTFGLRCSPFLAIRILRQLAQDEGASFSLAVILILYESYVDDVLSGAFSIAECLRKMQELVSLLKLGGFELGKWAANNPALIEWVAPGERTTEVSVFNEFESTSVLGLAWSPEGDYFHFNISLEPYDSDKLTKRSALSMIAKLFDPLGFLSPVTINSKVFIKSLWLLKCGWDSPLPPDYCLRWNKFYSQLVVLSEIKIPRWIGYMPEGRVIELHGFADASLRAYGAVLYVRVLQGSGVTTSLLGAKTKISPNITVPRLELCAAHLLTKLTHHFLSFSSLGQLKVHLWSDSKDVLYWIQDHPSRWQIFVANRCHEIQTLLPQACWHHVKGSENPADLISRGVNPAELKDLQLWWAGPQFLLASNDEWPELAELVQTSPKEERPAKPVVLTVGVCSNDLLIRFSSLNRLLRVTCWCLRFIRSIKVSLRLKQKLTSSLRLVTLDADSFELTPAELHNAELLWISIVQKQHFAREMELLAGHKPLKQSTLLKLNPFLVDGLLRIGGRLKHSALDYEEKHPLILPDHNLFTKLLVLDAHQRSLHGGTQLTLATLRCRYWILKGRQRVKSIIGSCLVCRRHSARVINPFMASLPSDRVRPAFPFEHSGVDFAGPFKLRLTKSRGKGTMKAYIGVFTCLATRATHLELVEDYTTEAFLAAFTRFTCRRGHCSLMRSDRGTNFVGADKELRKMFNEASEQMSTIIPSLATLGTQWVFNPPQAPHFGGVWESVVKSTKFHLRRIVGEHVLNFVEFSTLLCKIEACINSRPLGRVSDDAEDWVLTPAHFLIQRPSFIVPEPLNPAEKVPLGKRWRWINQMAQDFWSKWSKGHLKTLQERQKWFKPSRNLQPGDLVLIKDDLLAPAHWSLGTVEAVHLGTDGQVRVADVRTADSTYTRPVVKLILLLHANELASDEV